MRRMVVIITVCGVLLLGVYPGPRVRDDIAYEAVSTAPLLQNALHRLFRRITEHVQMRSFPGMIAILQAIDLDRNRWMHILPDWLMATAHPWAIAKTHPAWWNRVFEKFNTIRPKRRLQTGTGGISGTVRDATTGQPVMGVTVQLYDAMGLWVDYTLTDSQGAYMFSGLAAGTYYLIAVEPGYIDTLYDGILCGTYLREWFCFPPTGTGVTVVEGQTTTGIDFNLTPGGGVSGTVERASTHEPVIEGTVAIIDTHGHLLATGTVSSGAYTIPGFLIGGVYYASAFSYASYDSEPALLPEVYSERSCLYRTFCRELSGTPFTVVEGQTTTGIDFTLSDGGWIGANAYDRDFPDFTPESFVTHIYNQAGFAVGFVYPESWGFQRFPAGLPAGTYFIRSSSDYLDEVYADHPCERPCLVQRGDPVVVTTGGISRRTFYLRPGAVLSGKVVDAATGQPLGATFVHLREAYDVPFAFSTTTIQAGANGYDLTSVPPGSYRLIAEKFGYTSQAYRGIPCTACDPRVSVPVHIRGRGRRGSLNFKLRAVPTSVDYGGIRGRTLDATSLQPVAHVRVVLYDASGKPVDFRYSNTIGVYAFTRLPPGTYYVYAERADRYVGTLYGDVPCPGGLCDPTVGTPVTVQSGQFTVNVDIHVPRGGRIAGTVRTPDLQPIRGGGIPVLVYDAGNRVVGYGITDDFGTYVTTPLPAGTYYVVAGSLTPYIPELYQGIRPCYASLIPDLPGPCIPSTGTPVSVSVDMDTTNIDFTLEQGGQIEGVVRDGSTQEAIHSGIVLFYDHNGRLLTYTITFGDGAYRSPGLPTGTYHAATFIGRTYMDELYDDIPCFNGGCIPVLGTPIAVTQGAITGGIDFFLETLRMRALNVDVRATSSTSSNLNGVLEPGETVQVAPTWENRTQVPLLTTGSITAMVGPDGATYTIVDANADYGLVGSGAARSCTVTGDCYVMRIDDPEPRPWDHWDVVVEETLPLGPRVYTLHVGRSFTDVPPTFVFYRHIETLFHRGITSGCGPNTFCPMNWVNRGQMAIFISMIPDGLAPPLRYRDPDTGRTYDCRIGMNGTHFTDVPSRAAFCPHVHYLWARGIVSGCSADRYCPYRPINRGQMAIILSRKMVGGPPPAVYTDPNTGRHYDCTDGQPNHFIDVPDTVGFCPHVHYIWARGVVGGCTGNRYCPYQSVLRAQMAAFLVNGFALSLYP